MKFHLKTMIFVNWSKNRWESISVYFFCFQSQGGHLKIWFRNSKNINHCYDVIKRHVNEDIQKTFARSHCQTVQKMVISIIFLTSPWTNAEFICIHFHRTLSEGQEIDIRSFFFARSHLKSYYWNSIFLVSHHSAWSYWEFIYFVFVYRLMNHVARPKIFFCIILLITLFWNHEILSELCTSFQRAHSKDFKNICFIEIERPYRKLSYFFDLSGQNDQFRPRN